MKSILQRFAQLCCALIICVCADAQVSQNTGSIQGQVLNIDTGKYIYQVRVRVVDAPGATASDLQRMTTFTDDIGHYWLSNIPVGKVTIEAFLSGFPPQTIVVDVPSGGTVTASDIPLSISGEPRTQAWDGDLILLDKFVVESSREMSGVALAVNSQRFAANTRSVVSVDEMGFTGDGSIAGALKFLPGIDIDSGATGHGFDNAITLSGAPSANVPVSIGGFSAVTSADLVQNASGNQNQRSTNLAQLSLNSLSRVEINRSPTPDMPGSALAGSINLVPKSAFERARPSYVIQVFGSANEDSISLSKKSGSFISKKHPIKPGIALSAVVPLRKDLGFSLSLSHSTTPKNIARTTREKTANWDPSTSDFRSTPNNPDHYMLYSVDMYDVDSIYTKDNINLTVDYRPYERGTLTFGYSQSYNELESGQRRAYWQIHNTASLDLQNSTLTTSQSIANPAANRNEVRGTTTLNNFIDKNRQLQAKFRHNGPVWNAEAGASYGTAGREAIDLDRNLLFDVPVYRQGAVVKFEGINSWTVDSLSATYQGNNINPTDLSTFIPAGNMSYTVTKLDGTTQSITTSMPTARTKPYTTSDKRTQIYGNLSRSFDISRTHHTIKAGFDYSEYKRDQKYDQYIGTGSGYVYNGTDVSFMDYLNPDYTRSLPGGLGTTDSLNSTAIAEFFKSTPSKWIQINPANDYTTATNNNKYLHETITAAYLRIDSQITKRLLLVYGLRFERTTDKGEGPLYDPTLNYVPDPSNPGHYLDTSGNTLVPGGSPMLANHANSLVARELTYITRGAHAKRSFNSWHPSLNANYTILENLIARFSYSQTIGRPDIYNVAPGMTVPGVEATAPRFTITNPGIAPWKSHNISLSLELYSSNLGDITLRAYRRWVRDGFVTTIMDASDPTAAALLNTYGIDLGNWENGDNATVSTLRTVDGTIVTSGLELSGRYNLDALLPQWGRGLTVKFSVSRSTFTGNDVAASSFAAQNLYLLPWSVGGGISLSRKWFSISLTGKWNDRQQRTYYAPASTYLYEPGTYDYLDSTLRMDLDISVRITKNITLFVNGRDINGYEEKWLRYGPNTPDLLKGRQKNEFQPVWTAGVTATF
jgi:TonB-dependent receptor